MAYYPPLSSNNQFYRDGMINPSYQAPRPTGGFQPSQQDEYNQNLTKWLSGQYSKQMDTDMAKGRAAGMKEYGPGSLGRLDEARLGETAALLGRYNTQSQQGFAAPEFQAARERYLANINQQTQGGLQQAASVAANSGVRGAAAAGLSNDVLRQSQLGRQEAERQAKMDDLGYRTAQQDKYGQGLSQAQGSEMDARKYNLEQIAREKQGVQAYQFGYGSLGAAQQAGAQKYIAGQQNIEAARAGGGGASSSGGK